MTLPQVSVSGMKSLSTMSWVIVFMPILCGATRRIMVAIGDSLLATIPPNVQLVNCIGSHQDESTIEFSDALGYKGNVDRASGEFMLRESKELLQHVFQMNPVLPATSSCSSS
jgi:hypothetical protein